MQDFLALAFACQKQEIFVKFLDSRVYTQRGHKLNFGGLLLGDNVVRLEKSPRRTSSRPVSIFRRLPSSTSKPPPPKLNLGPR